MKRFIQPLILWIIILLAVYLTGCSSDPIAVDPSEIQVLSIKDYYPEALSAAQEWNPSAYLTEIVVAMCLPDAKDDLKIHYRFRTRDAPGMWFLVSIRASSDKSEILAEPGEYAEDTIPTLPQVFDIYRVTVDSFGALEIAYHNGAQEFLSTHEDLHQLPIAILEREKVRVGTGNLQWKVIFTAESLHNIQITIDAHTGEVLETIQGGYE